VEKWRRSWNVYENKGTYSLKAGILLKINELEDGRCRRGKKDRVRVSGAW